MTAGNPRPLAGPPTSPLPEGALPARQASAASAPTDRAASRTRGELLQVIRTRPYQLLWSGTALLQFGFWMQQTAQGWLTYDLTSSSTWVGAIAFGRGLPMLLLSLAGGILADRYDRRRLLVVCQAGILVAAVVLTGLTFADIVGPWHLLALALVSGVFFALVMPARQSIIPTIVPRPIVGRAVALNTTAMNAPRVVGPSLAGILIAGVGVANCFLAQTVFLAFALWASSSLRLPPRAPKKAGPLGDALLGGFRYIRSSPALSGQLMLAVFPPLLLMPFANMMPIFARDILFVGPQGLGLLLAVHGAGGVTGSLLVAGMPQRRRGLVVLTAAAAMAVITIVFAFSQSFPLSLALMLLIGLGHTSYMATNITLIHLTAPDEVRGRVVSVYMMTLGLMPIGAMLQGVLADVIGVQAAVAWMSVVCLGIIAAIALANPVVRRL